MQIFILRMMNEFTNLSKNRWCCLGANLHVESEIVDLVVEIRGVRLALADLHVLLPFKPWCFIGNDFDLQYILDHVGKTILY